MTKKKLTPTEELGQLKIASNMIQLGARMQVLQAETDLPRSKLLNLYREVVGESPPKGLLPSSEDWFLSWMQNIDSSLFVGYFNALIKRGVNRKDAIVKAFRLYQDQLTSEGREGVLTFSRAWTLVRFIDGGILHMKECQSCGVEFIAHKYDQVDEYNCLICRPPSRATAVK